VSTKPRFVPTTPVDGAEPNDCFPLVERHVAEHGGSICYGWTIWEWAGVYVEAEFHAVWQSPSGEIRDVTPKPLPVSQILFLPDPSRTYEGRQVNNVRRPLSSNPDVAEFLAAADAEFEFMNRGARGQHGAIPVSASEAAELETIRERRELAYARIVAKLPQPGRNDPCPCGSGKKFKKCHAQ
jgi:SEC-C motif